MTKLDIPKLKNIFSALANEKRIRIIELFLEKQRNVTELSRLLKLNYSITVEYTSMLEKVGLLSKKRNEDRTVNVKSLIKLNNHGEIKKI
jgi:predicted transcriptional regulator